MFAYLTLDGTAVGNHCTCTGSGYEWAVIASQQGGKEFHGHPKPHISVHTWHHTIKQLTCLEYYES